MMRQSRSAAGRLAAALMVAVVAAPVAARACTWDYAPSRDPRAGRFAVIAGGTFGPWLIHCQPRSERNGAGCTLYYDFSPAQMGLNLGVASADDASAAVNFGVVGSLTAAAITIARGGRPAARIALACEVTELSGRIDGRGWPVVGSCPAYTVCRTPPEQAAALIEQLVAGQSAAIELQPSAGPAQTIDLDLARLREAWTAYWRFRARHAAR